MEPYLITLIVVVLGTAVVMNLIITYALMTVNDEVLRKVRSLDRKIK